MNNNRVSRWGYALLLVLIGFSLAYIYLRVEPSVYECTTKTTTELVTKAHWVYETYPSSSEILCEDGVEVRSGFLGLTPKTIVYHPVPIGFPWIQEKGKSCMIRQTKTTCKLVEEYER